MSSPNKKMSLGEFLKSSEVFVDGDWIESKDQDPDGEVRLIQLADIGVGNFIDKSSRYLTHKKAVELKCTFLEKGDLLIARMPDPIGRCCIFPGLAGAGAAVTVVDVCIIRPDLKKIHPEWLMHFINSEKFQNEVASWVKGTTRQRISRGNLSKISINTPTLPEQRRIAAILDKAEALRGKRREAIAKLDQLLLSVFLEMFGDPADKKINWPLFTLETVATTRLGKMLDKKTSQGDNMKKYLANLNVQWGRFILNDLREMNFDVADQQEFNLLSGDILMCEGGEPGRCAIWEDDVKDCYFQKALHRIRCNKEKCTPEYISYLFYILAKNGKFRSSITTATIAHLPGIKLKKLEIPVPPIDLQRKFSNLFNEIRSSQLKHVNSLKKIEIVNSSIQTSFFTN